MDLLKWLRGSSRGTDLIRLSIHMDYTDPIIVREPTNAKGMAAVQWHEVSSDAAQNKIFLQIILIALLYAEVIVIDSDSRKKLVAFVSSAIERWHRRNVGSSGNQEFFIDKLTLPIFGIGQMPIWPWEIWEYPVFEALNRLRKGQLGIKKLRLVNYVVVLKTNRREPAEFWSYTEIPISQAKTCAPSAPLIAIYAFIHEMQRAETPVFIDLLCMLLNEVHQFYLKLGMFPPGSQAIAVRHALGHTLDAFPKNLYEGHA